MACEKKWAIVAVFVSVVVVLAVVVPIAVISSKDNGNQPGQLNSENGAPSEMFLQYAGMIKCVTKKNPLAYQGYGCNCGLFSAGGAPVDATDRCCVEHDACLKNLETTGVCPKASFMIPYAVKMKGCRRRQPATITCKPEASYSIVEKLASLNKPACAAALCECDRVSAMCFATHELDPKFKSGNKNSTLCQPGGAGQTTPGMPAAGTPTTSVVAGIPGINNTIPAGPNEPAPLYRIST